MTDLIAITSAFLQTHCSKQQPVLLGLSGGPDSLALFHCLLSCSFPLHVAHIDHAWRPESREEALQLRQLAAHYGIPFHEKILTPSAFTGNLEAACRAERYAFFETICNSYECQGVMVAHHAGDQTETVLKRIFEGASWSHLSGLRPVTQMGSLRVLRPFLSISKEVIRQWLQKHQLTAFEDSSNNDSRFLRGKMRCSLIPWLSQEFGKEIGSAIRTIGEEAAELRDYFDQRISRYLSAIVEGKMGLYLDLSELPPENMLEIKYLIRKICTQESISLSRSQVEVLARALYEKKSNQRMVLSKDKVAYIDRGYFFILREKIEAAAPIPLDIGEHRYGSWRVEVTRGVSSDFPITNTRWTEAWQGKIIAIVPPGSYWLGPLEMGTHESLGKWWTNHKIPAFMRALVPVLWKEGSVYLEFLTGAQRQRLQKEQRDRDAIKITLTLVN